MSQYCKLLILSSFYFICGTVCFCQSLSAQHTDNMKGYLSYPLNKSFVMYDFANNITEINQLHSYIKKTLNDPTFIIRKIEVTGYSSPEGSYEHNEKLAQERAENLKNYLHPFFDEQDIRTSYVPEDWDGLVEALAETSHPQLENIRALAQSELTPAEKEKELRRLPHRIYKELCRNYFPLLRRASLTIYCEKKTDAAPADPTDETGRYIPVPLSEQEQYLRTQQTTQHSRNAGMYRRNFQSEALADRYGRRYYGAGRNRPLFSALGYDTPTPTLAVGTNLLQWAGFRPDFTHTTVIPNIYLEYYFLKRWSVKAAFAYCDWSYDSGTHFQGISSYSIEPRYWLKDDEKFRGFFAGVYAQAGDYNQKAPDQNYTGKFFGAGLSAGYLYPVYKGLAVEVSLRGGYRHASVKKYRCEEECNNLCRKYKQNRFTVTGSCISLIYRF